MVGQELLQEDSMAFSSCLPYSFWDCCKDWNTIRRWLISVLEPLLGFGPFKITQNSLPSSRICLSSCTEWPDTRAFFFLPISLQFHCAPSHRGAVGWHCLFEPGGLKAKLEQGTWVLTEPRGAAEHLGCQRPKTLSLPNMKGSSHRTFPRWGVGLVDYIGDWKNYFWFPSWLVVNLLLTC